MGFERGQVYVRLYLFWGSFPRLTGSTTPTNCTDPQPPQGIVLEVIAQAVVRRGRLGCAALSTPAQSIGSGLHPTTFFATLGFVGFRTLTTTCGCGSGLVSGPGFIVLLKFNDLLQLRVGDRVVGSAKTPHFYDWGSGNYWLPRTLTTRGRAD